MCPLLFIIIMDVLMENREGSTLGDDVGGRPGTVCYGS